jgi:hypothetical protein
MLRTFAAANPSPQSRCRSLDRLGKHGGLGATARRGSGHGDASGFPPGGSLGTLSAPGLVVAMSVKGVPMRNAEFREHLVDSRTPHVELIRSPEDESFITYNQLPNYGIPKYSRVHLRRLIVRGLFPRPVMLSPNRIAWRQSDLVAWKTSRPMAPCPSTLGEKVCQ